ncbi:hypothetical protein QVD17_41259 [Tagetes erecta]|uniref:Uncharacterized protein n=1 Tax=Tagetes erecta TaxID=13708 RepID=A0AAD8JSQ4_TARER|nr:hypothetical protein QVD17_41259 [Tagetes erecta]
MSAQCTHSGPCYGWIDEEEETVPAPPSYTESEPTEDEDDQQQDSQSANARLAALADYAGRTRIELNRLAETVGDCRDEFLDLKEYTGGAEDHAIMLADDLWDTRADVRTIWRIVVMIIVVIFLSTQEDVDSGYMPDDEASDTSSLLSPTSVLNHDPSNEPPPRIRARFIPLPHELPTPIVGVPIGFVGPSRIDLIENELDALTWNANEMGDHVRYLDVMMENLQEEQQMKEDDLTGKMDELHREVHNLKYYFTAFIVTCIAILACITDFGIDKPNSPTT